MPWSFQTSAASGVSADIVVAAAATPQVGAEARFQFPTPSLPHRGRPSGTCGSHAL